MESERFSLERHYQKYFAELQANQNLLNRLLYKDTYTLVIGDYNVLKERVQLVHNNLSYLCDSTLHKANYTLDTLNNLLKDLGSTKIDMDGFQKKFVEGVKALLIQSANWWETNEVQYLVNAQSGKEFIESSTNRNFREEKSDSILELLAPFAQAHKLYESAIEKRNRGNYERNSLDDLRLSLELLLKELLGNNKPLEKQIPDVGNFQKTKGRSAEVTNMFQKLLDCYSTYQNTYVKHNDKVNKSEIELLFELTSSFMKFIVAK